MLQRSYSRGSFSVDGRTSSSSIPSQTLDYYYRVYRHCLRLFILVKKGHVLLSVAERHLRELPRSIDIHKRELPVLREEPSVFPVDNSHDAVRCGTKMLWRPRSMWQKNKCVVVVVVALHYRKHALLLPRLDRVGGTTPSDASTLPMRLRRSDHSWGRMSVSSCARTTGSVLTCSSSSSVDIPTPCLTMAVLR